MSAADYLEGLRKSLAAADVKALTSAADRMAQVLVSGNVVHTFGCGHSALAAAEPVYRANTIAALNFLGLLPGPSGLVAATAAEKQPERAVALVHNGGVRTGDLVVVVSHSGGSLLALAVVEEARRAGAAILAVTCDAHTNLARRADLVLVTDVASADALLADSGLGPASSIVSAVLLDAALAEAAILSQRNVVPLLKSVHAAEGPERNIAVMGPLAARIPSWFTLPVV